MLCNLILDVICHSLSYILSYILYLILSYLILCRCATGTTMTVTRGKRKAVEEKHVRQTAKKRGTVSHLILSYLEYDLI